MVKKNQNSTCLGGGREPAGKGHERIFWSDGNVLDHHCPVEIQDVGHICNFKFSGSNIKKETSEILIIYFI